MITHEHLVTIVKDLPQDYDPYGRDDRNIGDSFGMDCSCGCKWAVWLEGDLGLDWCVCSNPLSHRVGLLTFEHQGCRQFEDDGSLDETDNP